MSQSALDRVHVRRMLGYASRVIREGGVIGAPVCGHHTPAQMERERAKAEAILTPIRPTLQEQGITVSELRIDGQSLVATATVAVTSANLIFPVTNPIQHFLPRRLRRRT